MIGAEMFDEFTLIGRFVKVGFLKANREGSQFVIEIAGDKRGNDGGIKSATQVGPNRNVCPQSNANGIQKKFLCLFNSIFKGPAESFFRRVVWDFPERLLVQ